MLGTNIRKIRKLKGISINNLSKLSGVSLGYLSDLENNKVDNPTIDILNKIADVLDVSIKLFFEDDATSVKEETETYETKAFDTPQEAMKFILEQPAIAGFGGFNPQKMSDAELVDFANELLNQLKLLGYKYKR